VRTDPLPLACHALRQTLKPYLTPEGMTIFGGARPKDDDDGTR
jgi:hypothetical protein